MYTEIYIVKMYTHFGEIQYKYFIQLYYWLYYLDDQAIFIFGKVDQCNYD